VTVRSTLVVLVALLIAPVTARSIDAQAAGSPAAGVPPRVQMGVSVSPDTVTIGDPFELRVRVRAPLGSTIHFPAGPDSTAGVEALDRFRELPGGDANGVERTAVYRLAAWDVGVRGIAFAPGSVSVGGVMRALPITGARVFVRSVLPADSALRVPKPPRDVIDGAVPWALWKLWWALAALLLLALLAYLWWRRSRREKPVVEIDAFARAEAEFERLERMGLVEAGERGRYVALNVNVLRDYLARRVSGGDASLTSTELLAAFHHERGLPVERLGPVLAEADLIKFARRPVTAERARAIAVEARELVRETERVRQAAATALVPQEAAA
jgi:hypothetical protein